MIVKKTILYGGLLLAGSLRAASSEAAERPNVIFILTDDMGYGDMGCEDHPYVKTPNIDRLAREGTRFNNFYVNSAVCSPSRTAFMTGIFPARNNAHHIYLTKDFNREHGLPDFLDPDILTVADVMKQAGYTTGHIGKWHLCGSSGPAPSQYGFDMGLVTHSGNASAVYRERWKTTEHQVTASSHWIMEDGIDFIKEHKNDGAPFYLNLWTLVPHGRLNPSPEELAVYAGLEADPDDFSSWMREYAKSARDLTAQMKVYCASMTSLDSAIGKLLDYLDESGLSESTLLIFSSDNGPEDYHCGDSANGGVGSPGEFRGRKRSMYLGGMRVPMIIRWPGKVPAGNVNNSVWSAVDLLPTLASIVDVDLSSAETAIDGEALVGILQGGKQDRQKPLFWEWKFEIFGNQDYRPPQLAMLDGKWWAGCNPDQTGVELYDITTDPAQRTNVKEQYPEVADRLVGAMVDWKKTIPESFYESASERGTSEAKSVMLKAIRRTGFGPSSGVVKSDERRGGTGVFGCAEKAREVYLWFEVPSGSPVLSSLASWEMELVISGRSGTKDVPKTADELQIDFLGSVDEIYVDGKSLKNYSKDEPIQSFTPDFQGKLMAGRYRMTLAGFDRKNVGTGRYLLFRFTDSSPEKMNWSEVSLKTNLMGK